MVYLSHMFSVHSSATSQSHLNFTDEFELVSLPPFQEHFIDIQVALVLGKSTFGTR